MTYSYWDMGCDRQNFLPFWTIFCTYPPNNPKNQNFEKMKKLPGDIIFHMCTINDNHMMYGSWDMERDRQNFLLFWTVFFPFTPQNQNFKKMKIIIKNNGSWDIERDGQIFLSFWTIFCAFTPLTTWKIKILKKLTKHLEILSF